LNIALGLIAAGCLVFLAHLLDDLFARTKIPDVLLLLGLGLLLGPALNLVRPEQLGAVGPLFTTVTLVIILFEGGLGLDLGLLFRSLRGATLLTVLNFLGTLIVVAPMARLFLGMNWLPALTLGAILAGTSSAVVIPMVKRLNLADHTRTALALESALSDVFVIVVALGLMEAQKAGELHLGSMFGGMLASFLVAGLLGILGGLLWSLALNRIHGLQNSIFTTPAFVCVVYGVVELLGFSGAIAALTLGVTLGNLDRVPARFLRRTPEALASLNTTEREVFSEVVFLLKTFFFVYIGVSIQLGGWMDIALGLALTIGLFLVRIPVVHASLPASRTTRMDALACSALVPKGLAAAVLASIPLQMDLPHGDILKNTVFAVVLFSILIASLLVLLAERGWMTGVASRLFTRFKDRKCLLDIASEEPGQPS